MPYIDPRDNPNHPCAGRHMDASGKCSDGPAPSGSGQVGFTHTTSDRRKFTGPTAAQDAEVYENRLRATRAPTSAPAPGGGGNIGIRSVDTNIPIVRGGAPGPAPTAPPIRAPRTTQLGTGRGATPVASTRGMDGLAAKVSGFNEPSMRLAGGPMTPERKAEVRQVLGGGAPGGRAPAAPAANVTDARPPGFATFDRSGYDKSLQDLDLARNTFLGELDRLSGVDPFGNQAFLQKATDRAVAQASGTAAMARGGAAAQAGAHRTAQGIQAQATSRGVQEMEQVRSRDEVGAGQLRATNAQGLAGLSTQRAGLEVEVAAKQTETLQKNLDQWIQYSGMKMDIDQRDVESIREMSTELKAMEVQLRGQDIAYRDQELDRMMEKYGIDRGVQTAMRQIAAGENMSTDEFIMGLLGMGSGLGGAAILASDRRFKEDVRDPDLRDLQDFLGNTRGKLYRYREPGKPGQRAGENYGPMAQDLQKSKIGRTVVVDGPDGLYVDTGRLALADHAALAELAREVAALKSRRSPK